MADYNIWANDIVYSWFEKINDEQWQRPLISSFKSIGETALHVARAETIWLERLQKSDTPTGLDDFNGTKQEIINSWSKASYGLRSFIENLDERDLPVILGFKRINGEYNELPHYQILAHVFNHSCYHRGQLVTMLRQVGFTDVSSTDMSSFFRNKIIQV